MPRAFQEHMKDIERQVNYECDQFQENLTLTKNRIEVIMTCPYCGQDTRLRKSYKPVKTGDRETYECEKCGMVFYGIVEVQTIKMRY